MVTGSSGYLGSHLARELRDVGAEVLGVDVRDGEFTSETFDLVSPPESPLFERAELVFHVAGLVHRRPKNAAERQRFFDVNVGSTRALLERCNAPMVLVSSSGVYGHGGPHREEDRLRPLGAYGESKAEAERLVLSSARGCVVRPSMFFGEGAPGNLGLLAKLVKLGLFPEVRSGRAKKSMAHVSTIVDGMMLVGTEALKAEPRHRVFNLSDAVPLSMKEVALAIGASRGKRPLMLPLPSAPLELAASALNGVSGGRTRAFLGAFANDATLDTARLIHDLGFRPRLDAKRAITGGAY